MELNKKSKGVLKALAKRKIKNHLLADLLLQSKKISLKQHLRIESCCDHVAHIKEHNRDKKMDLLYAWTCGHRLCPVCSKSKTSKLIKTHEKLLIEINKQYPNQYKFLFLTLTIRNCKGHELKDQIKAMTNGFNKMTRYKAINNILSGYIRRVEVTYNDKEDTYHPHIHVLLMVKTSYKPSDSSYIEQKTWIDYWAKAMKLDYSPNVDIRLVRNKKSDLDDYTNKKDYITKRTIKKSLLEDNIAKQTNKMLIPGLAAVQEISKYSVKPVKIQKGLTDNQKSMIYGFLHEALKGVRVVTYGGLMKQLLIEISEEEQAEFDKINLANDTSKQLEYDLIRSEYIPKSKKYKTKEIKQISLSQNPKFANKQRYNLIKEEAKTTIKEMAQKMR